MQDNLEFLQWTKKFWDQHFAGGEYDAYGRRKGSGAPPSTSTPTASGMRTSTGAAKTRRAPTGPTATTTRTRTPLSGSSFPALQQEIISLKENVTGLEKERDFYFLKLRDIELLLQRAVEADPEIEKDDEGLVKQIQNILYSTEVRF